MIKFQNYTPSVYYTQSRDFQFIGRLFDVMLCSAKTNADMIYNLPIGTNANKRVALLSALTLGFVPKHDYTDEQLMCICKVFPEIIRKKGTEESILIACDALLRSEHLSENASINVENCAVTIYLPQEFKGISILRDVLQYILPAGMPCDIKRLSLQNEELESQIHTTHIVVAHDDIADYTTSIVPQIGSAIGGSTVSDTGGFMANSAVVRPGQVQTDDNEN